MALQPSTKALNDAIRGIAWAVGRREGIQAARANDPKLVRGLVDKLGLSAQPVEAERIHHILCGFMTRRETGGALRACPALTYLVQAALTSPDMPDVREPLLLLSTSRVVAKSLEKNAKVKADLRRWQGKQQEVGRTGLSQVQAHSVRNDDDDIYPPELWARPRIMLQLAAWAKCEAKHKTAVTALLPVLAEHLVASPWNFVHCGRSKVIAHDLLLAMIKLMGKDAAKRRVYSIVSEEERGNEKEYVGTFEILGTGIKIGELPIDRYSSLTDATTAVLAVAGSTGTTEQLNRARRRRLPIVALPQFGGRAARYADEAHSRAIGRGSVEYKECLRRLHAAKEPSALAELTIRCLRHAVARSPQIERPR